MTVYYNEVALGRWLEQTVRSLGIRTVLGTVLQRVVLADGRLRRSSCVPLRERHRKAHGFVDASGDAALTWQAGLPCWVPERTIYGSQQVIVENVDETHKPGPARSTPCSPREATNTGCSGAAGWPSSSPAGAPRC